jgi:hypothetical protein
LTLVTEPEPAPVAPEKPARRFEFWACWELRESLGIRAETERQLLERLETVPAESIYYHSVRSLLRRSVAETPFPDDFATWVANEVRDFALAERLAWPSPFDFPNIESFRAHLLETLDDHLSHLAHAPRSVSSNPFCFLRGHLTAMPLEVVAGDLPGLRRALGQVDDSSIYFHTVEAAGRPRRPHALDLFAWVERGLGLPELAHAMGEVDPFVATLSRARAGLIAEVDKAMRQEARR